MILTRILQTDEATYGVLSSDNYPLCVALELPWLDNQPNSSCIPTGEYSVQQFQSPEHGQVWEIMNVPGRSAILIHEGNFPQNSLGCVLCAQSFSGQSAAIYNSDVTIELLRNILPAQFTLTIKNSWN